MSRRGAILQDYGGRFEPMPQDAQLAAASYYQRDKELAAQLKHQNQKDAEADKYRKLNMINDATDPKNYQSSTQKANSLATGQLLGVRNEFAAKTNLPPDQLYLELQQKLAPITQGYTSYKEDLDAQEALAKEAAKANPNLDLEKILVDVQNGVDSHHLTTDKNGGISFNQATIGVPSNSLTDILKPENAWKYSKGSKGLMDILKKGGDKGELFSQAPDKTQINYTTNLPFWAQITDENGNPLEPDKKTGLIPTGKLPRLSLIGTKQDYQEKDKNGNIVTKSMTVVPQKTMDAILYNDELKYQFEGDWQKHKMDAGIVVDPAHEDDLKRVYFSQLLQDNGLPQPYVSSRTHLPPQPRTTINNRFGGDGADINDLYGKIDAKATEDANNGFGYTRLNALPTDAQNVIIDFANKGKSEEALIDRANIFIKKQPNGMIDIYQVKSTDADGKQEISLNERYKIGTLPKVGTNLKVQPNAKSKVAVVAQGETSKSQSKFNIVDPRTGKVVLSGVDKNAADKAKAKGYKIQ